MSNRASFEENVHELMLCAENESSIYPAFVKTVRAIQKRIDAGEKLVDKNGKLRTIYFAGWFARCTFIYRRMVDPADCYFQPYSKRVINECARRETRDVIDAIKNGEWDDAPATSV